MSVFGLYRRRTGELAMLIASASLLVSGLLAKQQSDQRDQERARSQQADRRISFALERVVKTGRVAIRSGCDFDNQRAHAIRGIVQRSMVAQRKLYLAGAFNRRQYLDGRKQGRRAIRDIVVRDCAAAASVVGR